VRAEQLLNWIEVRAGEMIYVDAGTVHTIGPGVILLETQQNSDTTYRLYDYGRPRQLHVQQGLAALKEKTRAGKVESYPVDENAVRLIVSTCFMVIKTRLEKPELLAGGTNREFRKATVLVGLEGCGVVRQGHEAVTLGRGDVIVIPAAVTDYSVHSQWTIEYLTITLPPPVPVEEPQTR